MSSMQVQPGADGQDSQYLPESIHLDEIWAQLTSRYEARSLVRIQRWVETLFASFGGAAPARLPQDSLHRPRLLYLDGLEDAAWFDATRFEVLHRMEAAFEAIHRELHPDLDPRQAGDFTAYFPDEPKAAWRVRKFFDNGERIEQTFRRYPTLGRILANPELPSDIGECRCHRSRRAGTSCRTMARSTASWSDILPCASRRVTARFASAPPRAAGSTASASSSTTPLSTRRGIAPTRSATSYSSICGTPI